MQLKKEKGRCWWNREKTKTIFIIIQRNVPQNLKIVYKGNAAIYNLTYIPKTSQLKVCYSFN